MIRDKSFDIPKNLSFADSIIENIKINIPISSLSQNERTYMTNLLCIPDNSHIVRKIQSELKNMLKYKCIYLNDIPQLIYSIATLIKTDIAKNHIKNINIIAIVRYIITLFFDSKLLPLNDSEICLIQNIISSSLKLLQLNTTDELICCTCLFP